ncbi:MAG TPA: adenylate/guanylate cyclase domain-containing protein [Reyranella sp.]|jgi:class 3 adenylate cyclase|nr:adenylate/guanylate cyclase domain-containing protein [Reyranella sp.]
MNARPAEIASLRRRYLWMAVSIFFIDLIITLIFSATAGSWNNLWRSEGIAVLLLLGGNWLIARYLFEPIRQFLVGELPFDLIQRRLTQLPLLTARYVGLLAIIVVVFRNSTPWWVESHVLYEMRPTVADFIALCVIIPVFYFTYTYFVVSDYLTELCSFIFERYGQTLRLFFGSYALKLLVALVVISIAPLAAVVVDLFSYSGDRLRAEILVDVSSAIIGVAISAYFIGRSLLKPFGLLSRAMTKVAEGDLGVTVPVTSNDEVGELTARFNDMIQGLREREQLRETFGRYVDESVAATILRRQGQDSRSGETGEATILFSDIAGFTTIAEYLTPAELVGALNDYLETVLAPIREHGGVVHTFIGDGLFASFNMPLACESHAVAAVRAALDIQRAVGSRTFGGQGVALATRIGISTGPVIGGDIGAGKRMNFTLLGDTVNLAARLEELNKQYGTRILVSQSTRDACGETFNFDSLGSVTVRGRSESVAIFSVDPKRQETAS